MEEEREAECARLTQTIKELEAELKRLRTVVANAADALPGGQARMLLYYENVKHASKRPNGDNAAPAAVGPARANSPDSPRSITATTTAHATVVRGAPGSASARTPRHRKPPERKERVASKSGMVRPEPSISWRGHQEEAVPSTREIGFVRAAYRLTGGHG